jgi:protein-L-isoaspartate(D-aspartate) O-methyltransferase
LRVFDPGEVEVIRRAYARHVTFLGRADNRELEAAFAEVPRESYLGAGPWPIWTWSGRYISTPNSDPAWLYADILVGIRPEQRLNNGQPSAHATWIAAAAPSAGEHVVHVGAGVGYFSAIMAHMVGSKGRLTAIEYEDELAARAAVNLAHIPGAAVIGGDGSSVPFDPADVIYVNAGASHPIYHWLDRLKEGGRLILPLTTDANFSPAVTTMTGAVFRITRRGEDYEAAFVGPIGVFPCIGARDEASEAALSEAFRRGGFDKVRKLRRTDDVPDSDCWVKAPGWSLTFG